MSNHQNADFTTHMHLNPSGTYEKSLTRSVQLNNQALAAESAGNLATAEGLHLEAISLKESILGNEHPTTALSYNGLGELYLKMKKLDEAEQYISKAVQIRNARGTVFDAAVSRENMAQIHEARGNLAQAKESRLAGAPDKIACGYFQSMISAPAKLLVSVNSKPAENASLSIIVPPIVRRTIGKVVTNRCVKQPPKAGFKLDNTTT